MSMGGTITISAKAETVSDHKHPYGLAQGAYLCLAVADTGSGMDAETLTHAMEPFFTTKASGEGTGLGLPMARGFAEQSGGALVVDSEPGQGTTVSLWLPAARAAATRSAMAEDTAVPLAADRRRILLVDDEELVREVLAEELSDRDYDVICSESGATALALLDAGEPVDLLVTDFAMPEMDGLSLIREFQRRRPKLPAILLTGYVGEAAAIAVGKVVDGPIGLLRKPVSGAELADQIATMLEAKVS
jgi:CheY-like chemotaxis protein